MAWNTKTKEQKENQKWQDKLYTELYNEYGMQATEVFKKVMQGELIFIWKEG